MNERLLSLACIVALCPACFDPSTGELADSGTAGVGLGEPDTDTDAGDEFDTAAETSISGGNDSNDDPDGGSTGSDPADEDPVDEGTTTDDPGEDETDGSTGEVEACTELGTDEDCLFCGDQCGDGASCYPQGCLAAVELGFAEDFGSIGGVNGFLYGFPVEVDTDGYLTHFGFIAAGQGAGIQMALYSDLDGAPHALLAESESLPSYDAGPYELTTDEIELPAGTYWLMATLGYPRRISADLNGGQVNFAVSGITHDFGAPLPSVLAEPNAFVNFRPAFFVGVLQ